MTRRVLGLVSGSRIATAIIGSPRPNKLAEAAMVFVDQLKNRQSRVGGPFSSSSHQEQAGSDRRSRRRLHSLRHRRCTRQQLGVHPDTVAATGLSGRFVSTGPFPGPLSLIPRSARPRRRVARSPQYGLVAVHVSLSPPCSTRPLAAVRPGRPLRRKFRPRLAMRSRTTPTALKSAERTTISKTANAIVTVGTKSANSPPADAAVHTPQS